MPLSDQPLARLDWNEIDHVGWPELLGLGVPPFLGNLAGALSMRSGRRLQVYVMPTLRADVASLAVPRQDDDAVIVDPSLLNDPGELSTAIARELASMLHPRWCDARFEEPEETQRFASKLGSTFMKEQPSSIGEIDSMVGSALRHLRAA